jgi:uncharacterized protein (PEP-CTERM system associated)
MAITTRPERAGYTVGFAQCAHVLRATAILAVLAAPPSQAQSLRLEPSIQVNAVASDNTALDARALADVVITTSPRVGIQGSGAGYRLTGFAGLDATTHLGRTTADRLIPRAGADANVRLVDRLLFLDAGFKVDTAVDNPYGVAVSNTNSLNQVTTLNGRFSPYLERELGPDSRVVVRTDHNWVQVRRGSGGLGADLDAYLDSQSASYELRPLPVGLSASLSRQASSESGTADRTTEQITLRVSPVYAVSPQLNLSISGGVDRARYATVEVSQTMAGAGVRWAPSERTLLEGTAERRFFGTGGNLSFTHRLPFLAFNLAASRTVTTYASQLVSIPAGVDVAQLLDAALTTRIPSAVERAAAVQRFIEQRNLPSSLASAVSLASGSLQRIEAGSASVALLGIRHTVALRVFQQRTIDLLGPNDVTPLFSGNARQSGGSVTFSRRVSPETTAETSFAHTKVVGLGQNDGLRSGNTTFQVGGSHRISARTTAALGMRHQSLRSTAVPSARENAVTATVTHRF